MNPRTLSATDASPALRDLIVESARLLLSTGSTDHLVLRRQLECAQIREIELTGVGVFAKFAIPADVPRISASRLIGGDVQIELEGVQDGAGALICISDGTIDFLEMYTFGNEPWPDEPRVISTELRLPLPASEARDGSALSGKGPG